MIRRTLTGCGLLLCVGVVVAGCGGQHHTQTQTHAPSSQTGAGTPATGAQVLMLARVLESNLEHGGAHFSAAVRVSGQPVAATGRVSFRSGRGTMLVRPVQAGQGPPRRYFWTRHVVLAQASPGSSSYAYERPNEQGNPIHAMIGFINLLSAETIDNTTAIQSQSPRLLRQTIIDGARVDEFSLGRGGNVKLWILRRDGLLRRVSTTADGITVDLVTHQRVKIVLPAGKRG